MEATRIAIAPLAGFTDASGRARRHQRHAAGAVRKRHLDLQRGIASAVQRLEGADIDDMHGETLYVSQLNKSRLPALTPIA